MALSIWVPISYITVLVCGMLAFSRWQRYKKQAILAATEPWFAAHPERDLYITLLQASQQPPTPSSPPIDDRILMAALLCRAITDVTRIWSLRDTRPLLSALITKGSLSEETNAKFAQAEKELEAEVTDVVNEANSFREGWGSYIFASASEMAHREKMMDVVRDIGNVRAEEARKLPAPSMSTMLAQAAAATQPNPSSLPVPTSALAPASSTPTVTTKTSNQPTSSPPQQPQPINPSHLFNPSTYPSNAPPLNGPAVLPQGVQLPPGASLPPGMTQLQLMQFLSVQQARAMAQRAQQQQQQQQQQQLQQQKDQQKQVQSGLTSTPGPATASKLNGPNGGASISEIVETSSMTAMEKNGSGSSDATGVNGAERKEGGGGLGVPVVAAGGGGGPKASPSKTTPSKKKGKRK